MQMQIDMLKYITKPHHTYPVVIEYWLRCQTVRGGGDWHADKPIITNQPVLSPVIRMQMSYNLLAQSGELKLPEYS